MRVSFIHLVLPLMHFLWELITYLKIIISFFFSRFSFQKVINGIIDLLDWCSLIFCVPVFVPLCSCSVLSIFSLFSFNSYIEYFNFNNQFFSYAPFFLYFVVVLFYAMSTVLLGIHIICKLFILWNNRLLKLLFCKLSVSSIVCFFCNLNFFFLLIILEFWLAVFL